jgi:hypothetical protein
MTSGEPARESPAEAAERRMRFALEAIERAVREKVGNPKAHGKFSAVLHWKAGHLEHVTIEDSANYK